MATAGRRIEVRGTVQGVGFRPWVYRVARQAHVTGRVLNHAAGVTIDAFGTPEELGDFCAGLTVDPPPAARIQQLEWADIPPEQPASFTIVASRDGLERVVSIPADLATCPACAGEISDPSNRRYRYPFTNCTDCGPRFTIALDVPYDRPRTSMASFAMCTDCQREYDDPADRRFHAQPNACPTCGPRLTAEDALGVPWPGADPIALAARAIEDGLDRRAERAGGIPSRVRCDVIACRGPAARAQATRRETVRRHGARSRRRGDDCGARRRRARVADVDRAADRSGRAAGGGAPGARGRAVATRSWGCCCRTRRCIISCSRT